MTAGEGGGVRGRATARDAPGRASRAASPRRGRTLGRGAAPGATRGAARGAVGGEDGAAPRPWRWLAALCLSAALVGAWGAAAFVQRAQVALATLPGRVRRQLALHDSPFVPLSQVSPYLVQATIAVEDRSFWTNPGISLEGIARAALVDVASAAFVEGGSTITQQLVRDQLLGYQKSVHRKLEELAYALLCARRYPKAQVLALYLNEVNYGHGAFGVWAASETYFGLPPADLDLAQAALLAGLPQDPAGLDPYRHPRAALERRRTVLAAMVAVRDVPPALAAQAARESLDLLPAAPGRPTG